MSALSFSARTRLAAVIGDPVEHSLSPTLHNAAFAALDLDAVYVALPVSLARLEHMVEMLAGVNAVGVSITVPHKQAVMPLCARLSEGATRVGAVNCLELDGDSIVGHNTDATGFAAALRERYGGRQGPWTPLVLGAGGAARAVCAGLAELDSAAPVVIARTPSRVAWTEARPWTREELATRLPEVNLIVDCTSAGLSAIDEKNVPVAVDVSLCSTDTVVSSLIYHREPKLLADARARGLSVQDGTGMLIHQALGALQIWLGRAPPASVLWNAISSHRAAPG